MSLPAGFIQNELFSKIDDKEDYETNENPMVRKYGLTWNRAKCGGTSRTKPCVYFDPERNRCTLRKGEHNSRWDACGKYEPKRGSE